LAPAAIIEPKLNNFTRMKKLALALATVAFLSITACHYGQEEAEKTLERNEQYKGDKADYSVNHAGEGGKITRTEEVVAPAATATDSTAKH
jgi:hypothetical protein